jgi:1-deoxy-D-xylulose-5-phosphate reductoisomerase
VPFIVNSDLKSINILGVTGSVGQAAADVIAACPDKFDVRVVTAHKNAKKLAETATRLNAKRTIIGDEIIPDDPVDITLAAISGMAGLHSVMEAIKHSKIVAIANKEPLVAAGAIIMAEAKKHGTKILPVDSEHNAIFQVFDFNNTKSIERIILTASGGPFRTWTTAQMKNAMPEQALKHPNWSMGKKITIDSATMMNKALEVIEAHILFDMPPEKIEVVIHPQSIIHSMVEYCDGSVLAQMGASDMRTPLSNVLAWPDRLKTPGQRLDFKTLKTLDFEPVDHEQFPAIKLAFDALRAGPWACTAINAANEVAVEAFLNGRIGFLDIVQINTHIFNNTTPQNISSLDDVELLDRAVRRATESYINETL